MSESNENEPAYRRPSDDDVEGHAYKRPDAELGEESIDDVEGHAYKRPDASVGEESDGDDVQGHMAKRP